MTNLSSMDISNLRAMKNELMEQISLHESALQTTLAMEKAEQLRIINEEISKRLSSMGNLLKS